MKRILAKALGIMGATFGIMSLASCSNQSFYKVWSNAGADIDEEVPFLEISYDKAKEMKENKETFLVMFGSTNDSTDVSNVQGICYDAYVTNQDSKIYFVNCDDAVSSVSTRDNYTKELGVKNVLSPAYLTEASSDEALKGLVAVLYVDGKVEWDTSKAYAYDFCQNFATSDATKVNIHSVAAYAWEYYPAVEE